MIRVFVYRMKNITKTRLFKYIENFTTKNWKFSDKNSDIFHISAQNIDCGYSWEPPRRGGSHEYPHSMFFEQKYKIVFTPVNPNFAVCDCGTPWTFLSPFFYYNKFEFKGVKVT